MNKYKEALCFIVKNSCPSKCTCSECNLENVCNSLAKDKIDILQELIDRQEKHEWHDLRKDPSDLPENNSIVLFAQCCFEEQIGYGIVKFDENYIITKADLAWKYIEKF